ncbi:MAG: hypothetical protein JNK05_31875 [Myxococcales bacterium]|nr:hypothetical protein [Myxococcales bacterium]
MSASDVQLLSRVCDAQARLQRRQHEQVEIEASNARGEGWRAVASSTMVGGTALAIGECVTGTTVTGRPMSRTECAVTLVGAALSWTGPAYMFTSRVMRTEALALATLSANVRLRDVLRASVRMTPADREALQEIYRAMRGSRPGEFVELTAQQEQRAREILERAGLTSDGTMGALEAGRRYEQLVQRGDPRMMMTEFGTPQPMPGEAPRTDWTIRRSATRQEQHAATRAGVSETTAQQRFVRAGQGHMDLSTGHIAASVQGTFTQRMEVLFHERVHRLFHARVEGSPLRRALAEGINDVHAWLRADETRRDAILNIAHEALAESITQLRLGNANWLGEGLRFPFEGGYNVRLARLGTELIAGSAVLGLIQADGVWVEARLEPAPFDVRTLDSPYPSELAASARRRASEADVRAVIRSRNGSDGQ